MPRVTPVGAAVSRQCGSMALLPSATLLLLTPVLNRPGMAMTVVAFAAVARRRAALATANRATVFVEW